MRGSVASSRTRNIAPSSSTHPARTAPPGAAAATGEAASTVVPEEVLAETGVLVVVQPGVLIRERGALQADTIVMALLIVLPLVLPLVLPMVYP